MLYVGILQVLTIWIKRRTHWFGSEYQLPYYLVTLSWKKKYFRYYFVCYFEGLCFSRSIIIYFYSTWKSSNVGMSFMLQLWQTDSWLINTFNNVSRCPKNSHSASGRAPSLVRAHPFPFDILQPCAKQVVVGVMSPPICRVSWICKPKKPCHFVVGYWQSTAKISNLLNTYLTKRGAVPVDFTITSIFFKNVKL